MGGMVEPPVEPVAVVVNVVNGTPLGDTLRGTIGVDSISGRDGNDVLNGFGGGDSLYGGVGNDTIVGYLGDVIFGGSGIDAVSYSFATRTTALTFDMNVIDLTLNGVDSIFGSFTAQNDVLIVDAPRFAGELYDGLAGVDRVIGNFSEAVAGAHIVLSTFGSTLIASQEGATGPLGLANYKNFEDLDLTGSSGNDFFNLENLSGVTKLRMSGGLGDDTLAAGAIGAALFGGDGDDRLFAGAGAGRTDSLYGGLGDDDVFLGSPQDIAFGGAGFDAITLDLSTGSAAVRLGKLTGALYSDFEKFFGVLTPLADTVKIIWASPPADGDGGRLNAGLGTDTLILDFSKITGSGYSAMSASGFFQSIFSVALMSATGPGFVGLEYEAFEKITLIGSAGNDTITGSAQLALIYAGDGDDTVSGSSANERLYGGIGNDSLEGSGFGFTGGNDSLYGGAGNDTIVGGAGNDVLSGSFGDDSLVGNAGNDRIIAGFGNDRVEGGDANDTLNSDAGNDTMLGDNGDDVIVGGAGDDNLEGGAGLDQIYGGLGNDILNGDGDFVIQAYFNRLYGGDGHDALTGGEGNDLLFGGTGNDTLIGSTSIAFGADSDTLYGEAGADSIFGSSGADRLFGGTENDTLSGGSGVDFLSGDAGVDRFIFDSFFATTPERDVISGYTAGEVISFTDAFLQQSDLRVIVGAQSTLIRWTDGEILVQNYTGALTFAFGEDAPLF